MSKCPLYAVTHSGRLVRLYEKDMLGRDLWEIEGNDTWILGSELRQLIYREDIEQILSEKYL